MTIKLITQNQWQAIDHLGQQIEEKLEKLEVGLKMGGEPTFVYLDDFASPQWRTDALGQEKRQIAGQLLKGLANRLAKPGGLLHYGLGKLYFAEPFPRWALGYYWRKDGVPIWHNSDLMAVDGQRGNNSLKQGQEFLERLVRHLGIDQKCIIPAYEKDTEDLAGYVLPLLSVRKNDQLRWSSCHWVIKGEWGMGKENKLYLLEGETAIGLRLPLKDIAWNETLETEAKLSIETEPIPLDLDPFLSPPNSISVALSLEVIEGVVRIFIPPIASARSFLDLMSTLELTAREMHIPVYLEGYPPPRNLGIEGLQITPDPGVIEVNIHPASNWDELVDINTILYEEASQCRLGTEKYFLNGRRMSTGGGAHITIGGENPQESPFLRRPDLLRSFISYWTNHPSLSYLFSGLFVGSTSQFPRVDEARLENLYELELALGVLQPNQPVSPELIDRLLSPFLVDITGNSHRTAFCIDKLFPVENDQSQWGLLEFRFFDMPPDLKMRLLQMLLVRSFVAWFWEYPYTEPLIRWGTTLYDRFMLPYYLKEDLQRVIEDLNRVNYGFELDWFESFFEFRFPVYGTINVGGLELELRAAIEPWPVVGDLLNNAGTSRTVNDSLERIQVTLRGVKDGFLSRYALTCNNYRIPLQETKIEGEYLAGIKFRARNLGTIEHPIFKSHSPLIFKIIDLQEKRVIGGCQYSVSHPNGGHYHQFPCHHQEAEKRRNERFIPLNYSSEKLEEILTLPIHPDYPLTLDLRQG